MPTPRDVQDAQEDAIREWVPPHFPSSLSLSVHKQLYVPLSGHTYTPLTRTQLPCEKYFKGARLEDGYLGWQVEKRFNVILIRRERWGTLKGYSPWGQQYLHIVSESTKTRRMCVVLL